MPTLQKMQGISTNRGLCISFSVPSTNFRKNKAVSAKAKKSFQPKDFLLLRKASGIANKAATIANAHFEHTIT